MKETSTDARIVAFGGGTGMATLLSGLKHFTERLTVVVAVSDDGGSSGRLRKDFDIPPPGDIRNCLAALSGAGDLVNQLFAYRFDESDLKGHSFGNLFLTALTRVTGSFEQAVAEANRILNVRGKVLPAAPGKRALVAEHADGSKSTGEREISRSRSPILHLSIRPEQQPVSEEIAQAVLAADLLIFGPGSLYTSVLPTLLGPHMQELLRAAEAYTLYVCNVMTQPGETADYSAADHVAALERHLGPGIVDGILVSESGVPDEPRHRYAKSGAGPVAIDAERIHQLGLELFTGDIGCTTDTVRHDPTKLAQRIADLLTERKGAHV